MAVYFPIGTNHQSHPAFVDDREWGSTHVRFLSSLDSFEKVQRLKARLTDFCPLKVDSLQELWQKATDVSPALEH
jgi:hypothetical protein